MYGKSAGILLQVAYKGVIDSGRDVTEQNIVGDYNLLTGIIDKLGIDVDDEKPRNYGSKGSAGGTSKPKSATAQVAESAPTFLHDGGTWTDFRSAKAKGDVKPQFPDFKNQATNESVWLLDRDGAPTEKGQELVAVADTAVM